MCIVSLMFTESLFLFRFSFILHSIIKSKRNHRFHCQVLSCNVILYSDVTLKFKLCFLRSVRFCVWALAL